MASFKRGRIYMSSADAASEITDKRVKIAYILFIPDAVDDQAVIKETTSDDASIILSSSVAKEQQLLDFSRNPIIMEGVYLASASSNAQIILYTTSEGRQ